MLRQAFVVLALPFVALTVVATPAFAQPGVLRGLVEEATGGGAKRNDLEGGIWEYKVIERRGDKATVLSGKLRVKQSAAFDVAGSAKGSLLDERQSAASEAAGQPTPERRFNLPKQPKLGVLDRIGESNRGGDRIGDINYQKSNNSTNATPKVTFRFDADDEHPLTGEANVKYDTRGGGGVWRGTYDEKLADGGKERWTFELRAIED
ncbi:MAG: hypothetical protein AAFV43_14670 [Planctomycetota bacterium]